MLSVTRGCSSFSPCFRYIACFWRSLLSFIGALAGNLIGTKSLHPQLVQARLVPCVPFPCRIFAMFLCKTGRVIDGKWKCLKFSSWSWLAGQENMISIILQHFATYFEHLHRIVHFGWIQAWLPVDLSTLHSQSVILHVSSCVVVSFTESHRMFLEEKV